MIILDQFVLRHPETFITAAIPFIRYSSKEKIVKKALEVSELGADSIHCGSLEYKIYEKYLNDFLKYHFRVMQDLFLDYQHGLEV